MRSPSPRRRHSPERKRFFQRRRSPGPYKRNRSRSVSPAKRRPYSQNRRSRSPLPRRMNNRGRSRSRSRSRSLRKRSRGRSSSRSMSPRRRSNSPKRKSRGGRTRSRSSSLDRPKSKPMDHDHRDGPKRRYPSGPQSGMKGKGTKFEETGFSRTREQSPGLPGRSRSSSGKPKPMGGPDSDFDPYRDNSGGRGDRDYRTLPPSVPSKSQSPGPSVPVRPKERFDQTAISISNRFLSITGILPPFSPTENITIGIERNIPSNEPAEIPVQLYVPEVVIVRRKEEGAKALCQRTEFLGPKKKKVPTATLR